MTAVTDHADQAGDGVPEEGDDQGDGFPVDDMLQKRPPGDDDERPGPGNDDSGDTDAQAWPEDRRSGGNPDIGHVNGVDGAGRADAAKGVNGVEGTAEADDIRGEGARESVGDDRGSEEPESTERRERSETEGSEAPEQPEKREEPEKREKRGSWWNWVGREDRGGGERRRKSAHARVKGDDAPGETPSGRTAPPGSAPGRTEPEDSWDDGLIARRVTETSDSERVTRVTAVEPGASAAQSVSPLAYDAALRARLDALRELVGLSRTRLDSGTLAEAGRVLDEAAARRKLSGQHTVVAIAGATGSGKSTLFNALAGVAISETGVRRPTTAAPIACSWSDGAATLLDRLGIPGRLRRRPLQSPEAEAQLRGLVLVDLPDHDSAAVQHRQQVDRILGLVDAVIWVVDPEKYADAILHERYLRPLAGHAEVMFVVLNQLDRLPGEAAHQVLDDLRRLLDEDGIALGEYGEPGATVLALSALTGDGVGELREALGQFVTEREAPARRVRADLDAAAARLWPVYATRHRTGLSERARNEFAARLADAVGATAAGEAAERAWLRNANRACGTPWLRLWRWYQGRSDLPTGRHSLRTPVDEEATARQRVEQAVRMLSDRAAAGLPAPWAQAVREAAVRGAQGLPEALDELAARVGTPTGRPPRPGWWPAAVLAQASMTLLQVLGGLWLLGQIIGVMSPNLGVPALLMVIGIVGGPVVEWACTLAARGPARRYGQEAERRLWEAAAGCGRARVLDPVAAELLRYREVREQYGRVLGAAPVG